MHDTLETALGRLGYDFSRFELVDFIHHVARLNRREIIINALPLSAGLTAAWVKASTADYIFYDGRIHRIYQTHLILHEIAHIVLNHSCLPLDAVLPPEMLAELTEAPTRGLCRRVGRDYVYSQEEQEAEAFVFLIQKRLVAANRLSALLSQSTSIGPLRDWVDSMAFNV